MKVLILTQFYTPEPELRNHVLAQELAARGHQVRVITAFPNYPQGSLYPGYALRPWRREMVAGVQIVRLPLFPDHSRSPLRRSLCYFSFAAAASTLGSVLAGRADILFAYHPPLSIGLPAWWLALTRRIPFVYEIQDMWPETISATGMARSQRFLKLVERAARTIYRRAAAITVISPGFRRLLVQKGIPAEKIHVIPNWVDEGDLTPASADAAQAESAGLAGRFNIVYAGNMGPGQGLANLLQAASLLADLPALQFVLIGDGIEKEALQRQAQELGLANVRFLPRQPMASISSFYAQADALLVHLAPNELFEITIPGKTQASLSAGRAILACVSGDAADLVTEARAGIIARPGRPQELAQAVRQLYSMSREQRCQMGRNGRDYYLAHLSQRVLVDRYEQLFQQLKRQA